MKLIGSAVFCTLSVAFRLAAQTFLPGTAPLKTQGDLAAEMVDGINEYLVRATAESVAKRSATRPDRERLKEIIGAVDPRVPSHRWARGIPGAVSPQHCGGVQDQYGERCDSC